MSTRFALSSLALGIFASTSFAATAPDASQIASARGWFAEAAKLCKADHGQLWGKSLCGPKLVVIPQTRQVIANQADAQGKLKADGDVFIGQLPPEETIANTAVKWSGTFWSELLFPLPDDLLTRRTMLMHESFHRIQDSVGLPAGDVANPHMDTLEGRYTMQLEWRALDAALHAGNDAERRAHVADALAFRAARYQRFPQAEKTETVLERNEGIAEYTGTVLGNHTAADRLAVTHHDLTIHAQDAGLTRSFAYATGPAYGLLLDRYRPSWRKDILQGGSPAALLASSLHIDMQTLGGIDQRAARYDGAALMASEQARAAEHARKVAAYTAQLITGPVLKLPLKHDRVQFNPTNLLALGAAGTVYPTMQVSDDWGTINVDGGALLDSGWTVVSVAVSGKPAGNPVQGKGWNLQLAPGWQLVPGARNGDWTLRQTTAK